MVLTNQLSGSLHFLRQEAVLSEKVDGGNCSIYRGKVCWYTYLCVHVKHGIKNLASKISDHQITNDKNHGQSLLNQLLYCHHNSEYYYITTLFMAILSLVYTKHGHRHLLMCSIMSVF